jgi:uncharacterized protein YecT (DUF1311 family)
MRVRAIRLSVFTLVVFVLSEAGSSQEPREIEAQPSSARRSLEVYFQQLDPLTDDHIAELSKFLSPPELERLRVEHEAWRSDRDRQCSDAAMNESGGMRELNCLVDITETYLERRMVQLQAAKDETGPTRLLCRPRDSTSNARAVNHLGPEEHAVLNALLRDRYSSAQSQKALQLETVSIDLRAGELDALRSQFSRKSPDVEFPAELVESFCENNELPKLLEPSLLTLPEGVTLDVLNGRESKGPQLYVSSVGLSHDRKYALVHVSLRCGMLCGGGGLYLLQKQAQHWKAIAQYRWIN